MKLSDIGKEREEQSLQNIFNVEFQKVIENIMDERAYRDDKRKIQINITLVPQSERERLKMSYDIKTTLAPIIGGEIGMDIEPTKAGTYAIRPSISMSSLPGQVDYRDMVHDEDGVYQDDEE
ncbi:hypothetical protein Q5O14_07810 [Eubacteriaceae bacterium ES2]|nr:hypothetical protein Q5O14_07810 [Eubacteriaceae bacterium ES2]